MLKTTFMFDTMFVERENLKKFIELAKISNDYALDFKELLGKNTLFAYEQNNFIHSPKTGLVSRYSHFEEIAVYNADIFKTDHGHHYTFGDNKNSKFLLNYFCLRHPLQEYFSYDVFFAKWHYILNLLKIDFIIFHSSDISREYFSVYIRIDEERAWKRYDHQPNIGKIEMIQFLNSL